MTGFQDLSKNLRISFLSYQALNFGILLHFKLDVKTTKELIIAKLSIKSKQFCRFLIQSIMLKNIGNWFNIF